MHTDPLLMARVLGRRRDPLSDATRTQQADAASGYLSVRRDVRAGRLKAARSHLKRSPLVRAAARQQLCLDASANVADILQAIRAKM